MRRLTIVLVTALGVVLLVGVTWLVRDRNGDQADNRRDQEAEAAIERSRQRAQDARKTAELEARIEELEHELSTPAPDDDTAETEADAAPDAAGFDALASRLGGRVGVAYGPLNGPAVHLGTWTDGVAWSTIKVPLAIAVQRDMGRVTPSMSPAITASDNDAAARLWTSLGDPATAGTKVEKVLRSGGDASTTVQRNVVRTGFSAYGQTRWSLANQQRFARGLTCVDGASPIVSLMGDVTSSQRWGLGWIGTHQRFKGGWGPTAGGGYLVRQFGIVDLPSGPVAVAVAAEARNFDAGISAVNELAVWVESHASGGGPPSC